MAVKIALKQIRTARGLSQNGLAQAMGMTLQNVQKIEYGKAKSIPLDTLDKLCTVLNCDVGDLLVRVPDVETATQEHDLTFTLQGTGKVIALSQSAQP